MCFSEEVSWLTLIIGTVVNIACIIYLSRIPNRNVIIPILLVLSWQYALLMQIFSKFLITESFISKYCDNKLI